MDSMEDVLMTTEKSNFAATARYALARGSWFVAGVVFARVVL